MRRLNFVKPVSKEEKDYRNETYRRTYWTFQSVRAANGVNVLLKF